MPLFIVALYLVYETIVVYACPRLSLLRYLCIRSNELRRQRDIDYFGDKAFIEHDRFALYRMLELTGYDFIVSQMAVADIKREGWL
jgi:hypothetical protein